MKIYLGVTDNDWFDFLGQRNPPPEDINFWQPGGKQSFKALSPGAPFLFKLKGKRNAIGGVGFFSSHTFLPLSLAWDTFGTGNGCASPETLRALIRNYRGGSVGLGTLAVAESEEKGTIEEVYEPYLIQEGYLVRTSRGREATEKAYKHLGRVPRTNQGSLFS
jgi:hypothetical protein